MASKFTVPYAPSSVYRANNSIAELMLRAGAINAEGARRSGEIWGSTIANLGQQVGGAVADWQAQKQQKQAEEAKRQALTSVENAVTGAKPGDDIEAIVAGLPPEYRDMARQKHSVIVGNRNALRESRDKYIKSWADGLLPFLRGDENDKNAAELFLADMEREGYGSEASKLRNQFWENPGTIKQLAMQMAGVKPEAPKTRTIKTRLADGSEVEQIVEDRPGQTFASAAPQPKPPEVGSFEYALRRKYGPQPTPEQVIQFRSQWEAAGRKPDAPVEDPLAALTGDLRTAAERAMTALPGTRRKPAVALISRLASEGDEEQVRDAIRRISLEGEDAETRKQVTGRQATRASLEDTRNILKEMADAGVPTNMLTGTAEDLARKLGMSTNPQYVTLANRLMGTLINYRRASTGVQFGERESAQYERMFPNYKNQLPVNMALIDGLIREVDTYDNAYWQDKLGKRGAEAIKINRQIGAAASGTPADGDVEEWIRDPVTGKLRKK